MKKTGYLIGVFALLLLLGTITLTFVKRVTPERARAESSTLQSDNDFTLNAENMIILPPAGKKGGMSLQEALVLRRSVRSYSPDAMSVAEVGQLLWSAQGITTDRGFRTAPSAGATFPLEMFAVVNNVEGLPRGIYHYEPHAHTLKLIDTRDVADGLRRASLGQSMLTDAAVVLVFGAVYQRTTQRYNERGERYVLNEIGHASQNVHLQAAAMNLGTVVIGAYSDEDVEEVLQLDPDIRVLYMMPVGRMP